MYAIIQDGGKQYKVTPGDVIELEKKDCAPGSAVEFSEVLYYHNEKDIQIGTPILKNIKVKGVVEKHVKGPKITVFKFRRRKDSRCKRGHRQKYTRVRISEILTEAS